MCISILLPVLRRVFTNLADVLDEAVQKGEVRPVRAADLVISILSLNVMPFVGQPVMQGILNLGNEEMEQFIENRMQENLETIWSRLKI